MRDLSRRFQLLDLRLEMGLDPAGWLIVISHLDFWRCVTPPAD